MDIAKSLVDLRVKKKIKQNAAAKLIGISQTYLSQVESGKKDPSTEMLKKIAAVYDMPVSVIFFMAMSEEDFAEDKRALFLMAKPIMEGLINQLIL